MIASQSPPRLTVDQLEPVLQSTARNLLRHLLDAPVAKAQGTFADFEDLHREIFPALDLEASRLKEEEGAEIPPEVKVGISVRHS